MSRLSCAEDQTPEQGETGVHWDWNDVSVLGSIKNM